jgi:hypothetical protein
MNQWTAVLSLSGESAKMAGYWMVDRIRFPAGAGIYFIA